MSKEKQIDIDIAVEEMASPVREITVKCGKCEYYKDGSCLKPIDIGCDINEDILNECEALYNAGYRKQSAIEKVEKKLFRDAFMSVLFSLVYLGGDGKWHTKRNNAEKTTAIMERYLSLVTREDGGE